MCPASDSSTGICLSVQDPSRKIQEHASAPSNGSTPERLITSHGTTVVPLEDGKRDFRDAVDKEEIGKGGELLDSTLHGFQGSLEDVDPVDEEVVAEADAYQRALHATVVAVADELAAAAGLAMQKNGGVPAVIVRGYKFRAGKESARELIRPAAEDLFR